ncbi:hypothetical protein [Reyranella sp.]|uniref:hypothetical protein n=1 Tax=Reyranella sp. TaxID=1929291 RepID=UPI003D13F6A0
MHDVEGGGSSILTVPPGVWTLARNLRLTAPGMSLCGAGMRATRLKLVGGAASSVVTVNASGVVLRRLTICGNIDDPPTGARPHGLVIKADPAQTNLQDLVVESVCGYGILIRGRGDDRGAFVDVRLHNVVVQNCGNDGIDFKALRHPRSSVKGSLCARAFLRNIVVRDFSLFKPHPDLRGGGECGVDVRGQVYMIGIEILGVKPGDFGKPGALGVHFRKENPAPEQHGRGSGGSSLQNYYISLRAPADIGGKRGRALAIGGNVKRRIAIGEGHVVDEFGDALNEK